MTSAAANGSCHCVIDFLFACFAFFGFPRILEEKTKNQEKQDCTPQGGSSGRELGVLFCFLLIFVFSFKNSWKTQKQDCTPQGRGVVADSRVLSFYVFLFLSFLVL